MYDELSKLPKVSAAENAGGKGALQQQDAPKRCL